MLWTAAGVLLLVWLIGLLTANTLGGSIHLLLAVAVFVLLIRVIQGRNVLGGRSAGRNR
jgi:hypothetical protein